MEYKDYYNKIGLRFTIVNGDLVESETGEFLVSETFQDNCIYINQLQKFAVLITAPNSYIGLPYKLRTYDCTTLWTKWLDSHKGSDYVNVYKRMPHREYYAWLKQGMCAWFDTQPFTKVDPQLLQESDCLVYSYNGTVDSHTGVYIEDNKILHHLPKKLSCIDTLDRSKILGAYRYNGN